MTNRILRSNRTARQRRRRKNGRRRPAVHGARASRSGTLRAARRPSSSPERGSAGAQAHLFRRQTLAKTSARRKQQPSVPLSFR